MDRRVMWSCLAVISLMVFAVGCSDTKAADEQVGAEAIEQSPPKVVVTAPEKTDAEKTVRVPGTFEPMEAVDVYARITGYLNELKVDIGDEVKEGDEIARLTVPKLEAEVREARGSLSAAKSRLSAAKANREAAKTTFERISELREKNPGAVPEQKLDEARRDKLEAEAEVEEAKAAIDEAEGQLRNLRSSRGFSVVRAPFDGVVSERYLDHGALVREGSVSEASPIVRIARTETFRFSFEVPEALAPSVKEGESIKIRPESRPDELIETEISRTSKALDQTSRTLRAEADIENDSDLVRAGMVGEVEFTGDRMPGAHRLPSAAVRGSGEDRYVLVVEDEKLTKRSVVVGIETGEWTYLSEGVSSSDQVMVSGSRLATPGSKVEVAESK